MARHQMAMPMWHTWLVLALIATNALAGRSLRHVGRQDGNYNNHLLSLPNDAGRLMEDLAESLFKRDSTPQFLTNKTAPFSVNGSGIPDVNFDVGESYAGTLSISENVNDTSQMFFWFFPSTNPEASKEIIIWLNGGPGCSSMEGLLQENGPFLWQDGTYLPVPNPWSWNQLSNVIYVDQPIGTGFSTGNITATNEEDVASQFMGFWKNFVSTFDLEGYKIYLTGESYAGMYCPYIASAMIDANNTEYFNVSGLLVFDGLIGQESIQTSVPAVAFVDYWDGLFPFNDSFSEGLHEADEACGFTSYLDKYLVFPPLEVQPSTLPSSNNTEDDCDALYDAIILAAQQVNPCWDAYQVAETCPLLWSVLGLSGMTFYSPAGAEIYFDRADVKKAIHAPEDVEWKLCSSGSVFAGSGDTSLPSSFTALPHVIDTTQNVIIGNGALDYVIIANGTLLTIQNMTWGSKMGFQSMPEDPLYVPYHNNPVIGAMAAGGVMGTVHSERGLTYVGVVMSGHMIPQYTPSVAFRTIEFLLGRISSLSSNVSFTTDSLDTNVTQPQEDLGNGIAPIGDQAASKSSAAMYSDGSMVTILLFIGGVLALIY